MVHSLIVDQTHPVQASGKLVLQKGTPTKYFEKGLGHFSVRLNFNAPRPMVAEIPSVRRRRRRRLPPSAVPRKNLV